MKKILVIVILGLLSSGNAFCKTISSYVDIDFTSKSKKVLTKNKTKCFEHSTYGNDVVYKLKKKDVPYIYDFKSIYNSIDDYIFIDEVHVTPFANKFMANKIYNIILD